MNGLELLEAAHKAKSVDVSFTIPAGEQEIPVVITIGDKLEIAERQERFYNKFFVEYRKEGLDLEEIDEKKYKEDLDRFKANLTGTKKANAEAVKNYEDRKPENLADQLANKYAMIFTIREVIPLYLKNPDGTPFLKSEKEIARMVSMIKEDNSLMTLLSGKYNELFLATNKEVGELVKNSPAQES